MHAPSISQAAGHWTSLSGLTTDQHLLRNVLLSCERPHWARRRQLQIETSIICSKSANLGTTLVSNHRSLQYCITDSSKRLRSLGKWVSWWDRQLFQRSLDSVPSFLAFSKDMKFVRAFTRFWKIDKKRMHKPPHRWHSRYCHCNADDLVMWPLCCARGSQGRVWSELVDDNH